MSTDQNTLLTRTSQELFKTIEDWDAALELTKVVARLKDKWQKDIMNTIKSITNTRWEIVEYGHTYFFNFSWIVERQEETSYNWSIWLVNNELRLWVSDDFPESEGERIKEILKGLSDKWQSNEYPDDGGKVLMRNEWLDNASAYNFPHDIHDTHKLIYQLKDLGDKLADMLKRELEPIFQNEELQQFYRNNPQN